MDLDKISQFRMGLEKERRVKSEEASRLLGVRAAKAEKEASSAEGDLRIEREWRIALEETMMKSRETISELHEEINSLVYVQTKNTKLEEELESLRIQFADAQTTLEEVGGALVTDKLRVAELLEAAAEGASGTTTKEEVSKKGSKKPGWTSDSLAVSCKACDKEFNLTRRKHHCRRCGEIFCGACSEGSMALEGKSRPVRVCDSCRNYLSNI